MCLLAYNSKMDKPIFTKLRIHIPWTIKSFHKSQNTEKSLVGVQVRAVRIGRKLSTIEERRQDQSRLLR